MRTSTLITLSLALLATGCAPRFAVMPRYGEFNIDGDVSISTDGSGGETSLEQAGLEDDSNVFGAVVDFKWGSPHLTISTQASNHDGDGTLETEFSDGDVTIPAGADVSSELDLGLHSAILTFDLFPGDTIETGIGFGITAVDLDVSFTEVSTGEVIDADEVLPIPVLAARAGVDIWRVEVAGMLSGMAVDVDGNQVAYLDLDLSGRLRLFGGDRTAGSLVLGYRWVDLDIDVEDDDEEVDLDVVFDGIYIGFELSF